MKLIVLALLGSVSVLAQSCSSIYGQCGGSIWTGATCCATGSYCSFVNPYYSQCIAGSATGSSATTTTKSTASTATTTATTTTATTKTAATTTTATTTTTTPTTKTSTATSTKTVASTTTATTPSTTTASTPSTTTITTAGITLTSSTATPTNCAALYAQCGGSGWTGATCCVSGSYCNVTNISYSQCILGTAPTGTSATTAAVGTLSGIISSTTTFGASTRTQDSYPTPTSTPCAAGNWVLEDNVCVPQYCSNDNTSADCSGCGGSGNALCVSPPSETGKSGDIYDIVNSVSNNESFHYSRSTHFGLTYGGACGFGLYGLCSNQVNLTASGLESVCGPFCTAYPQLCADPSNTSLRGNFAAPNGNYYTQFKANLGGSSLDNYLSCGECYELIQTKPDGTDYAVNETGYTVPITLEIVDSCPCDANSKWCCGPGYDHCGEVSDFKYGCPLPNGSIHLDLSDFAMARLQTGNPNGGLVAGVIPTRYKRIPCPKPGNVYMWLRSGGGPYYFAMSIVNVAGIGALANVEISPDNGLTWISMLHDPNYTEARPQERYGSWTIPQGSGPFNPPIAMRVTSATGEQYINANAITSFAVPANLDPNFYYIDLGFQFTK